VEADKWLKGKACMGKVNIFMGNYRKLPLTANSKYMVKVAVLDTGIDLDHPLLESYKKIGQISQGLCNDLVTGQVPNRDSTGHGTHCAHTILKVCKTARLYIARVFESDEGDEAALERIIKVCSHGTSKPLGYY
jgi:subtilisin family serine protease